LQDKQNWKCRKQKAVKRLKVVVAVNLNIVRAVVMVVVNHVHQVVTVVATEAVIVDLVLQQVVELAKNHGAIAT